MRTQITRGLVAAGMLALAGTAAAQGDNENNGGQKLTATLTAPGAEGDTDGSGLFEALINPETERICYTLSAGNIDKATAAQIHAGATGDPVLTLDTPDGDDDDSEDCQDIDRDLALSLIQTPENFYVNVHTGPFPNGAIRGQLRKGS